MCPFCLATTVWIAAGAVSTGSLSAIVATRLWNQKTRNREEGEKDDNPTTDQWPNRS